jgi:hypothetical protein
VIVVSNLILPTLANFKNIGDFPAAYAQSEPINSCCINAGSVTSNGDNEEKLLPYYVHLTMIPTRGGKQMVFALG